MTKKWWKAAGVRAVKTVAQAAVAAIGTTAMLNEVDWLVVASTALLAGVLGGKLASGESQPGNTIIIGGPEDKTASIEKPEKDK